MTSAHRALRHATTALECGEFAKAKACAIAALRADPPAELRTALWDVFKRADTHPEGSAVQPNGLDRIQTVNVFRSNGRIDTEFSEALERKRAGEKLRRIRENRHLTYREVEDASERLAANYGNPEFIIHLSRLADIETKGIMPSPHRLYTLCAIYNLEMAELLAWYGIYLSSLPRDAASFCSKPIDPDPVR